jgi:hypothetical protein
MIERRERIADSTATAANDPHQTDLAEANQRAVAAEREAAMLRAMVEVLRLDRDAWREHALAPPPPRRSGRERGSARENRSP